MTLLNNSTKMKVAWNVVLTTPIDLGVDDPDYINNGASRYHGITAGPINPETHVLWIDSSVQRCLMVHLV